MLSPFDLTSESQAGPSRFMNPRATGPRFESQEQSFWSLYDYLLRIQVFPFGQIGITFLPPAPSPPGQPSRGPDSSCSGEKYEIACFYIFNAVCGKRE